MLYFAFVYPLLLYGIAVYANTCKSHLDKLMVLNNKILRIAQGRSIRTRTVNLYMEYNTLPLPALHQYEVISFVHRCLYKDKSLPDLFIDYFYLNNSFHSYATRSSDKIHLCSANSSFGNKGLKFKGSMLWNNLPRRLTEIQSHTVFKRELKVYLLQNLMT